jgi:hypothetical protein
MSASPPPWAFGAVAIDAAGDPHLAPGVHLRVFTAPAFGLPIRPFVVYRATDQGAQRLLREQLHHDITWVDRRGRVRTLPFEVTPENPVTGHIPRGPGQRAIAVGLGGAGSGGQLHPEGLAMVAPRPGAQGELRLEAFIDGPAGRRVVGAREAAPYQLAAPDLHGVVVSGAGVVRTAFWLSADVSMVDKLEPAFLLDLPVPKAARYEGLPDAPSRAIDRVKRGAPQRFGLHDDPTVSGPAAAAPATADDELKRVGPLAEEVFPALDRALNDLSQRPAALRTAQTLSEGALTGSVAQADVACLRAVLAGTADPGMGRFLGFLDVDTLPVESGATFVLYFVRAFLAFDPAELEPIEALAALLSGGVLTADLSPPGLPFSVPKRSADGLLVFDYTVPVVVFMGASPDRPLAPVLSAPLAPSAQVGPTGEAPAVTLDGQGPWNADFLPPEARREVVLPLSSLVAAPTLAIARKDASGLTSMNDHHPVSGRALALVPAVPSDAVVTGAGRWADRAAPEGALHYRVAQADWFGRWSEFSTRAVPGKVRPPPPAPVFELHYALASATPLDDAPRFGALRVRLNVPRVDDLAAGSRLLVRAKVTAVVGGLTVNVEAPLPSPSARTLDVLIPGPAGLIPRAGQVEATVNARWNDGVLDGPLGEPQQKLLPDPRPPAALVLDPILRYSARPDATGRARVVLEWDAPAGARYRVYNTDETRLRSALGEASTAGSALATGLLGELNGQSDPAVRGAAYTTLGRASLYPRELFNNLTAQPLVAAAAGKMRFSHDLSGSLTVLSFFKVVTLSVNNVESPFTDAVLLPVGVPSGGPPPRPLLDFLGFDEAGAARLQVTVVRGPQPAATYRLRRSYAASEDPLQMPVVGVGAVVADDPAAPGPLVFTLTDSGADTLAGGALRPWTRMSWRVEVAAPSPAGSALPGDWSAASGAVSGMRVPPAPAAPHGLAITAVGPSDTGLEWGQPDPLEKGSQGGYRFDVYRRAPGGAEQRAGTVLADDPTAKTGAGAARRFHFTDSAGASAGTSWRVVVLDPIGRTSPPSPTVTRS